MSAGESRPVACTHAPIPDELFLPWHVRQCSLCMPLICCVVGSMLPAATALDVIPDHFDGQDVTGSAGIGLQGPGAEMAYSLLM